MKASRRLLIWCLVALALGASAQARGTSEAVERARQTAESARDESFSLEERQGALSQLEESARLFLSAGEIVEAARVLNRAGRLQLILNKPEDSIASHREALALLKRSPAVEVEVDNLNGLGAAYLLLKKRELAEDTLRNSLSLSGASGYKKGRAEALVTLSDSQNYENHALALRTAEEALQLWQSLDDRAGLARTYTQMGQYYLAQSLLPEATQHYEQALALWRELNNSREQAALLISLGFIESRKGEWSNEISFMTQAQGLIDERAEPTMMGQIASGFADAFKESGSPEIAIIHYRRALDFYKEMKDPRFVAYTTSSLGVLSYIQKDFPEAITYLEQVLSSIDRKDVLNGRCREYLGRVYLETGRYDEALQNLQAASAVYTSAGNPMEMARVEALLGQLAERRGETERARQSYQQALETFNKLSDRVNQAAVFYALGKLELTAKNYDAAEAYLRQSIEATENIRRVSQSRDLTAAFSATVYERYEKYIECLMSRPGRATDESQTLRAFETSELARARSLAELLRSANANLVSGIDPQLAAQEKSLRQALRLKEDAKVSLLSRKEYQPEAVTALEAELAQLEAQYKQVNESIRARYPAYEQITQPAAWDLRRIQEQVIADDETLLLEYSLGADRSYVWAVTRSGLKSYELGAEGPIMAAAQRAYKLLSAKPVAGAPDELTPALQALSRLILAPVAAELSRPRIIVVADRALNYIPFQLLPAPSSGLASASEPLVANYEVINAPSATILGELRQEAAQRGQAAKTLAAFGAPVFASNYAVVTGAKDGVQLASVQKAESEQWHQALRDIELNGDSFDPSAIKPLFWAGPELNHLRQMVAAPDALVASEFEATREHLQSTDLTQYAILHFATHGLLDPKRPEKSGLVLSTVNREGQAQNGFVGLQDVYGLRAPVRLVVLSACQTGLGKDVRGEGLLGLTRGFMYAGASSVVASLWKVDDEATAELMNEFYGNLLNKGMTPAQALRAAQNSIRQNPQWRAPFYWAGFTLQGEYRQVIKSQPSFLASPSNLKMIASGALLVLLAFVPLWYRRRRRNDRSPAG